MRVLSLLILSLLSLSAFSQKLETFFPDSLSFCKHDSVLFKVSNYVNNAIEIKVNGITLPKNKQFVFLKNTQNLIIESFGQNSQMMKDTVVVTFSFLLPRVGIEYNDPFIHHSWTTVPVTYITKYLQSNYKYDWECETDNGIKWEKDHHLTSVSYPVLNIEKKYKVTHYITNGCGQSKKTILVTIPKKPEGPDNVQEKTKNVLSVTPNPFRNHIYIRSQRPSIFQLYNITGNKVMEVQVFTGDNEVKISQDLPYGIYIYNSGKRMNKIIHTY